MRPSCRMYGLLYRAGQDVAVIVAVIALEDFALVVHRNASHLRSSGITAESLLPRLGFLHKQRPTRFDPSFPIGTPRSVSQSRITAEDQGRFFAAIRINATPAENRDLNIFPSISHEVCLGKRRGINSPGNEASHSTQFNIQ